MTKNPFQRIADAMYELGFEVNSVELSTLLLPEEGAGDHDNYVVRMTRRPFRIASSHEWSLQENATQSQEATA